MKKAVDAGIKVAVFDTAVSGEIPGVTVSQQDDASLTELSFGQLVKDFNGKANIVKLADGNFLKLYRQVLKMGGQIHFKTDNQPLFEFSVEELPQFGFELSEVTRNLHENGPVGVMTDYEAKFHELGQPINRCVGTMVDWEEPEVPEDAEPAEETVEE